MTTKSTRLLLIEFIASIVAILSFLIYLDLAYLGEDKKAIAQDIKQPPLNIR